jgi:xanthine/CO dehydrogenase XdhC/CoxF family maturation factor
VNPSRLLQFFDNRVQRGEPLVLATVFETRGSTYSKAGAQLLVDAQGVFRGMLSGGCLEGDLAARARTVLESGKAHSVSYDLAQDDELWGMGVGCDGTIRVFLQALQPASDYAPFTAIAAVLRGSTPAVAATVIESTSAAAGAAMLVRDGSAENFGIPGPLQEPIGEKARAALATLTSTTSTVAAGHGESLVMFSIVRPPPRILVLGAGADAEPLLHFAAELGWRCTVVDHRPAYIDGGDFSGAEATLCVPAAELAARLDLGAFDAAIVMSHHLVSDRTYLEQLAPTDIAYIGLLGPGHRRSRLLSELGETGKRLEARLRGPAGLDLGGRGPAPIALSIVAEMQSVLSGR